LRREPLIGKVVTMSVRGTGAPMRERLAAALKDAIRAEDETRVATLRLVLAAIKDRERRDAGEETAREADDDRVTAVLTTMVKQRVEQIRRYEEGGCLDLAAREEAEIAVIREFLPRPMSPAEVSAAIAAAVADTDAHSLRDVGRVMDALKARYPGRIDLGKVGPQVKKALFASP
jgi:hypothetical protein